MITGGAHKFEEDIHSEVNMKLNKFDEIDSLVHGVEFVVNNSNDPAAQEVFYYSDLNENTLSSGVKKVSSEAKKKQDSHLCKQIF